MEIRALKGLLAALAAAGVTYYHDGDLTLQLGGGSPQVRDGESPDVEGVDDLQLPDGVPDPRKLIQLAYQRAQARKRKAA